MPLDVSKKLYKQEGRAGLYQVLLPYLTAVAPMRRYVPASWGEGVFFCADDYIIAYFYESNLARVTNEVLAAYARGDVALWRDEWRQIDTDLTALSRDLSVLDLSACSMEDLRARYDRLFALDQRMWAISIFIDCFDAGFDQAEIERLSAEHGLSDDEAHVLTTPSEPSYVTEWERAALGYARGATTMPELLHDYFWIGTNYSEFREIDEPFVSSAASAAHDAPSEGNDEKVERILKAHDLADNPLGFFRILTAWRDERKRLNFCALYGLMKILREVARRRGLDPDTINGIRPDQVPDLFAGTLADETLRTQRSGTFITVGADDSFRFDASEQSRRTWDEITAAIAADQSHDTDEIKGVVASKGVARGVARILVDFNDPRAADFKEGDILVTSMTRPEFLPLMKLAAAFVTNEGGVTSHAAIVSREMKKPCIIGTKIATQVLKDGDLVEVDADQGVVRIVRT